jgi:hypothetical protein
MMDNTVQNQNRYNDRDDDANNNQNSLERQRTSMMIGISIHIGGVMRGLAARFRGRRFSRLKKMCYDTLHEILLVR